IEFEALAATYGHGGDACALGAVKTNIGHLEFRDADRHAVRDAPWARGRHRIRACARSTAARNRHCSG
ncbi:hypothetical protein GR254_21860, partial [Mycobacterium tuberculosis]|nr:hypothetical protein [Mycobacterium tuberculosis]